MKSLLPAGVALLLAVSVAAQPSSPAPVAPVAPAASTTVPAAPGELAALEQFLKLSDAELVQAEQVIARLRAMTPAQRTALRDEIAAFRKLPEPQRRQLRQGWGWMPAEIQQGWREMMQSATPEQRAAIQQKLQSLSPEEKAAYRRELVEAYLKAQPAKK